MLGWVLTLACLSSLLLASLSHEIPTQGVHFCAQPPAYISHPHRGQPFDSKKEQSVLLSWYEKVLR